jgi:hypothetical protein
MAGISALLPADDRISRAARISGYFSYISGTVYHMSMSFLAAALASSDPAGWNRIISGYRPFMEPIGYLFAGGFAVVSLLYLSPNDSARADGMAKCFLLRCLPWQP